MKRISLGGLLFVLMIAIISVTAQDVPDSALLGGDNTVFDTSEEAFTNPLPSLSEADLVRFDEGDELFEQAFDLEMGLGPVYNAVSCEGCHVEDGRGRPPSFAGEIETGLLIRLAHNQRTSNGGTIGDAMYGGQLQDVAIEGVAPEATISITYEEINGTYADGTPYTLYSPIYTLGDLGYGEMEDGLTYSPRLATQMIGMGLLDAVTVESILANADPDDMDGDGISGRPNYVWDKVSESVALGRFGWKANQPNLVQQSADAYNGDMGITTSINPEQPMTNNQLDMLTDAIMPQFVVAQRSDTVQQAGDDVAVETSEYEVSDEHLDLVVFYVAALSVPAQRDATDETVLAGQTLFEDASCSSCHVSELQTGDYPSVPALANQTIRPYSDLLLHDMGAGLADGQVDFEASGREWRTAPLWGLGLFEEVNGYAFYLHDGRARSIEEAILWHGGEAEASRDAFINMSVDEREALLAFLRSL